jgi:energy-coupling factor transporter ATP-binding protein EcfA2
MPVFSYSFGGLHIRSDFQLSGLHRLQGKGGNPDIRITFAPAPPPKAVPCYSWPGRYGLQLATSSNHTLFLTARDGSFLVNEGASTIQCFPDANANTGHASEGLCQVLMRRVLPRITLLHGRTCFHGASVMTNPHDAIMLLGPSGAGKSTLSAALNHLLGWHVLSDDISITDNKVPPPVCFPAVSGVCLWPDSIASCVATPLTSRILPGHDDKRWCESAGGIPATTATLRALIFIDRRDDGDSPIVLRKLPIAEAMFSSMVQVIRFNPADTSVIKEHMDAVASLLTQAPAYRLTYPRNYDQLPAIAAYLRSYFEPGCRHSPKTPHGGKYG